MQKFAVQNEKYFNFQSYEKEWATYSLNKLLITTSVPSQAADRQIAEVAQKRNETGLKRQGNEPGVSKIHNSSSRDQRNKRVIWGNDTPLLSLELLEISPLQNATRWTSTFNHYCQTL